MTALCEVTVFVAHAASAPDGTGARGPIRSVLQRPRVGAGAPCVEVDTACARYRQAQAGRSRARCLIRPRDWVGRRRRRRAAIEPSISVPESRRECEDLRGSGFAKTNGRKKRKRLSTSLLVLCVCVTEIEKAASASAAD